MITPRDKYGFKKSTQWVNAEDLDKFEYRYEEVMEKQRKKWQSLIKNSSKQWPPICSKCKVLKRVNVFTKNLF
jgi:hypothetical protein